MPRQLSQTPGARRKRAYRAGVTRTPPPLSQTPTAQAMSLRRAGLTMAINSLGHLLDRKDLARPRRPCSCCGVAFQPTVRRRMLCGSCYRQASPLAENATVGIMKS